MTLLALLLVADAVSMMTASGMDKPVGLDWGATGAKPAAQIFKNVKVLGAASGDRFVAGMHSMQANLGAKCAACHDVEHKDFASDAKPPKLRAREMMRMNAEVLERIFYGEPRVSCWTCHRGELVPPKRPAFAKELPQGFPPLDAAVLAKPSEQVFKDVKALRGTDARTFGQIMGWFSRELGVKCAYCHAAQDFAASTAAKERAREMLGLTSYVADGFYKGDSPVGCGMCHRGEPIPLTSPGRHAK